MLVKVDQISLSVPFRQFGNKSIRDNVISWLESPLKGITGTKFATNFRDETHVILDRVSLEVNRGERIAILGVNGSGKTSLCHCISGNIQPDSGTVNVNGRLRLVLSTGAAPFPQLTGRENAHLMARFYFDDLPESDRNSLVEDAIQFSGIEKFANVPFENYSLGMKSRLSLSLISQAQCDVLILDEVYSNTDEFFQIKIQGRIGQLIKRSGAVIVISHSAAELVNTCDRGIILDKGQVIYDGPIQKAIAYFRFFHSTERLSHINDEARGDKGVDREASSI